MLDESKPQTLEEAIAAIAGEDGWWKSYAEDAYLSMAKQLMAKGFTQDEAVDILSGAYSAAASCFGG